MATGKKKILILMSDTGGGHRASAQAIVDALDELYPGAMECEVVDIWTDHAAWPLNKFVPWYQFLARNPLLWRALWCSNRPLPTAIEMTNAVNFSRFRSCIEEHSPDLVVSVHPLCQHLPLRVLRQMAASAGAASAESAGDAASFEDTADVEGALLSPIPFATVVTDLGGAHPMWFHRDVDLCCVPSDAVRHLAERAGLQSKVNPSGESKSETLAQVRQHGLPLRVGFARPEARSRAEMRTLLGIELDTPTVLVVGGGDGVGGIETVAQAIGARLGADIEAAGSASKGGRRQMVVVCGKNEVARTGLESTTWHEGVSVKVCGFVNNMDEWMAVADCLVTKAGPGTIAEACARGLPILLSSFLPGQEEGNVPFVVDGGFGAFETEPEPIASNISDWLGNPEERARMGAAALAAARPLATFDIARDLGSLIFESAEERDLRRSALQVSLASSDEATIEAASMGDEGGFGGCSRVGSDNPNGPGDAASEPLSDMLDAETMPSRRIPEGLGACGTAMMACDRGPAPDEYFVVSHI